MSAPKLTAKFRIKDKVPFSIETFSGKIFRCGVCGTIFFSRNELERHLPFEKNKIYDDLKFPEIDKNLTISVIYSHDIRDLTNPKYPKLQKGDKLLKKDINKNFSKE
ncbi:MAG: TFIIB-type zinc ribbon-containing protein [Ignavibacterium sp.]